MPSPASSNVVAGNTALATDYNNLRTDVLTGIYPTWTNKSGSTQTEGCVVIFDKSNTQAFTTTTIVGDRRVMGVLTDSSVANNASGHIAVTGIFTVNVQGNVAVGQALIASATAGRAQASGSTSQPGLLGFAVSAYSGGGAGQVLAVLHPDFYRAGAQVTVISTQLGGASGSTNVSMTVNLGASSNEKLVLCFVGSNGVQGNTPTLNGVNMTSVLAFGGVGNSSAVFKILTTATGNQTGFITGSGATDLLFVVLEGHLSSGPNGTANRQNSSGTGPTVSCTDAVAGDLVIAALYGYSASGGDFNSWGANQVDILAWTNPANYGAASRKDATIATETMSATLNVSRTYSIVSIPIHPA